jgi:hypothetical protein
MISLCHRWDCKPHQPLLPTFTLYICKVFASIDAYGSSLEQIPTLHNLALVLGFWVTCRVSIMSLHHCWGWQPPQTASCVHIRHMKSVWEHWYAVHGHMTVASNSYTHTTWIRFWGSGSLVESKWCHYIIVEAASHLKLLHTSSLYIWTVFECINILSMGIWQ